MPRLSIVIPVVNDLKLLDDTLVSVLENRPTNCEILIVHNQPYNDPYQLAGEVEFIEAPRRASLGECLQLALSAVRSPVIHVLVCGVEVSAGWADAAMRHFRSTAVGSVATMVFHRNDLRQVASAGLGYRADGAVKRLGKGREVVSVAKGCDSLCGPDILAAFYRVAALRAIGGFAPWTTDEALGIDIALAMRNQGFECVLEPNCLAKTATPILGRNTAFRRGLETERLFWQWKAEHGRLRSLAGHAALMCREAVTVVWRPRMAAHLAGRMCGLLQATFGKRRPATVELLPSGAPSVIPAPHFAVAQRERRRQATKVA